MTVLLKCVYVYRTLTNSTIKHNNIQNLFLVINVVGSCKYYSGLHIVPVNFKSTRICFFHRIETQRYCAS